MSDSVQTLQDMVEYIQITSDVINTYQQKVASLESEKADLEHQIVEAEKTASAIPQGPVFDAAQVAKTAQKLVSVSLLKEADAKKLTDAIENDPQVLLAVLDKIASSRQPVKPLGKPSNEAVDKNPYAGKESDRAFENCFSKLAQRL